MVDESRESPKRGDTGHLLRNSQGVCFWIEMPPKSKKSASFFFRARFFLVLTQHKPRRTKKFPADFFPGLWPKKPMVLTNARHMHRKPMAAPFAFLIGCVWNLMYFFSKMTTPSSEKWLVGGWTNYIVWKILLVKLVHFPKGRGENKKCFKPPPR